ncbi:MAG TPA: hypothetical protein HA285_00435 [Methanothermobacter thermautotrophicus]|uniref:Uncharacterized protein n=1 Tax=Methanothermobacter thermautotrophicus TaxID=145262 RepID=A0A7J4MTL8_METTF|nr:hypothetical protein [Methanothermobacter thermautotrophicus]
MDRETKIVLVVCFVLVAALGLTSGMLMNRVTEPGSEKITYTSEEVKPPGDGQIPQWHRVAAFTGSGDDYQCFTIRGSKFMVVMSATPMINYDINIMTVDVLRDGAGIATDTIDWGPTESPKSKTRRIEVSGGPGTYCVSVYSTELESWKVTIWDYY